MKFNQEFKYLTPLPSTNVNKYHHSSASHNNCELVGDILYKMKENLTNEYRMNLDGVPEK